MSKTNKKIFFVTAEKSGNDIAYPLIEELSKKGNSIAGVGDERFKSLENVNIVENSDSLSVMGFFEVLKQYKSIKKVFNRIVDEIIKFKPDILILVDAPSLNFRIAEAVKKEIDVKIYGLVSPTIWVWKYKRIFKVRDLYDNMGCILPFEKDMYDKENIVAEYVGHPLITNFKIEDKKVSDEVIGILPGSRKQEIKKHISEFKKVIEYFQEKGYNGKFLVSKMSHFSDDIFEDLKDVKNVEFEERGSKFVMENSSFLFVKSGTITLEALFSKKPFLIFYKTSFITYLIAKTFVAKNISAIGLPNIITGELTIPEYVQEWDIKNIYKKYNEFMGDKEKFLKLYNIVIKKLGKKDYIQESCKIIDSLIEEKK